MDRRLLDEAGRVLSALSPGKRETVREIAIDAFTRGLLPERTRHALDRMTGSSVVGEAIEAAIGADAATSAVSLPVGGAGRLLAVCATVEER